MKVILFGATGMVGQGVLRECLLENALLRLPFKAAFMFRPAAIVALHGIRSKTRLYNVFYVVLGPLLPLMKKFLPKYVTTTEQVGRAMIKIARQGFPKPVIENSDINLV
jgi:hypothetical protein